MKCSVGTDLVEISRIEKSINVKGFCARVLGEQELSMLNTKGMKAESVAANFASKEAFSKALGTGIRGFSLKDVQTLRDEYGKPYLLLSGKAKEIAENMGLEFDVSLTHTKEYAMAVVIAEKK